MTLDPKVKYDLGKYILYLEECMFGLTISDQSSVRRLAFQMAEARFKLCSLCLQSPL
jgi:hypothetical protein